MNVSSDYLILVMEVGDHFIINYWNTLMIINDVLAVNDCIVTCHFSLCVLKLVSGFKEGIPREVRICHGTRFPGGSQHQNLSSFASWDMLGLPSRSVSVPY